MRVLVYLAEAAAVVVVGWAAVKLIGGALRERRQRKALAAATWSRRVVPLPDGKVRVELTKHGVEQPIPVQTLDPQAEGFDVALYEAEARADELATSLNAGQER